MAIVRVTSIIEVDMEKAALQPGAQGVTPELMLKTILDALQEGVKEEWADIAEFSTFTTSGEIIE